MSEESELQLQITANAEGVKKGFGEAVRAILGLEQQADKTGAKLTGMGDGAEVSGKKVDRATQTMINSIKRTTLAVETGGDALKKFERQAEMKGISRDVLRPYLNQLREARRGAEEAEKATKNLGSSITPLKAAISGMFAGVTFGAAVGKLVEVQREFDRLNSSLITVTGSSAAAEREMAWLKDFAKETPFGLAQATEAFVKMQALGLNPTKAALTSFGNTASAMGKDLMQFVEAVADAATGEFERLKEFGVKASKEGDQVSLTFQGVTTTIKNSADDITKYLTGIGDVQFAGAMAERLNTLDGAIAGLGDSWDELFRTISAGGVGDAIADSVRTAASALDDLNFVLDAVNDKQRELGSTAVNTDADISLLGQTFIKIAEEAREGVYILDQLSRTMGGVWDAAKEIPNGFSAVAAAMAKTRGEVDDARESFYLLREEMRRASAERAAFKSWSATGPSADAGAGLGRDLDRYAPRPARVTSGGGGSSGSGGKGKGSGSGGKTAKPKDEFKTLFDSLYSKTDEGLEQDFYKKLALLEAGYKKGKISVDEYRGAVEQLSSTHEFVKNTTKQLEDAQKALNDQLDADRRLRLELIEAEGAKADAYALETQQMREELEQMGLTETQLYALRDARIAEQIEREKSRLAGLDDVDMYTAERAAIERNIEVLEDRRVVMGKTREVERAIKKNEEFAASLSEVNDAFKKAFTESTGDIGSMFKDLWKSALAGFKNLVYQMTVQPILIQVGASMMDVSYDSMASLMGLGNGGGGGIGSLMGGAQNASSLNSLWGAGSQALFGGTAGASTASLAYANGVGMLGGDSLGALIAANGGWGGVGTGAASAAGGASGAGGASSMGGAAMGGLATFGAVAALFMLLDKFGDNRPEFAGYASASSDPTRDREAMRYGNDATLDLNAGVLPARDALLAALAEVGVDPSLTVDQAQHYLTPAQQSEMGLNGTLDDLTTQSLYRMLQDAQTGLTRNQSMYGSRVQVPEWYEGVGYVDPASLGHYDTEYNADMTGFSRQMAASVLSALESTAGLFGDAGSFRVVAGMRDEGDQDNIYGGLQIERNGESLVDWEGKGGTQEWLRGLAQGTLDAFDEIDMPGWAGGMVAETRAAIAALDAEELGDTLGQTALTALDSLRTGMRQTATVLDLLGKNVLEFAGLTSDAIYTITQSMGGLDAFNSAYSTYVQGFYSAEEQQALLRRQVQGQFDTAGIELPDSRQAFRDLVDSLDLSTEAGQKTFASLMTLSSAFATLVPAADAVAEVVTEVVQTLADLYAEAQANTDKTWSAFQSNKQKEIDYWAGQESNWTQLADDVRGVFDLLHDQVRDLYGTVEQTRTMQADQARQYISNSLLSARATGALPDQDQLSEAIDSARTGLSPDNFATRAEYELATLELAAQLAELESYAGAQLSTAEQHAKYASEMVDLQTQELEYWQEQMDILRGSDEKLGTIEELAAAILAERKAKEEQENEAKKKANGGGASFAGGGSIGGGAMYDDFGSRDEAAAKSAEINAAGGFARILEIGGAWRVIDEGLRGGSDKAETLRDGLTTVGSADEWWSNAAAMGAYREDLAMALKVEPDDLQDWLKTNLPGYQWGVGGKLEKLPSFAVGASYIPRDMIAQLHGEEMVIPAMDSKWFREKASGGISDDKANQIIEALREVSDQIGRGNLSADRTARALEGPLMVEQI